MVPSVHSEMVIRIRPGTATKTAPIDADIKWYQGVSATGFFPVGLMKTPAWCGGTTTDVFLGDEAARAVELGGLLGDVIQGTASRLGLIAEGYGETGVCNDSVAVIQHALRQRAAPYPLLMNDNALEPEMQRRLQDRNHRDDPAYRALRESIQALPSDVGANPSQRQRALDSLPWAAGKEPFISTEHARQTLQKPSPDDS